MIVGFVIPLMMVSTSRAIHSSSLQCDGYFIFRWKNEWLYKSKYKYIFTHTHTPPHIILIIKIYILCKSTYAIVESLGNRYCGCLISAAVAVAAASGIVCLYEKGEHNVHNIQVWYAHFSLMTLKHGPWERFIL